MSFGNFSSAFLPTEAGQFNIHVLPEVRLLGHKDGLAVATLLEHYALVPVAFEPTNASTFHLHFTDLHQDLFVPAYEGKPNLSCQILSDISHSGTGVLLYVDSLKREAIRKLQVGIKPVSSIRTASANTIASVFAEHIGAANWHMEPTRTPSSPEPKIGSLDICSLSEVVDMDMPPRVLQALLPGDLSYNTRFVKHLTHIALVKKAAAQTKAAPHVRVHSWCATGDINLSKKCDCGDQFRLAMREVSDNGGAVIMHDAEGRGVHSLAVKMLQYILQDEGVDTYDAMGMWGYQRPDCRTYEGPAKLLQQCGISEIVLMTNNPMKVAEMTQAGIEVVGTKKVITKKSSPELARYLKAKRERGGHNFEATALDHT